MAIHQGQVYPTDPQDPSNQANMYYQPQVYGNQMYYQYPNQPMANMMPAQMAYPPNSQHQQFQQYMHPHMVPQHGVVYTQPQQQQQQQPQAPTSNQEQFPANAQKVPVAQVTPAAAAAAPLPQQQPTPPQPVVKPTILPQLVVAASPLTKPAPTTPPVEATVKTDSTTEAKFVAGLSTAKLLPNLTVPGLSTVKPSEASFIAGLDREKPTEDVKEAKDEIVDLKPVNEVEQTKDEIKMEETLEEPKEVESQKRPAQEETKLGVDFPFGRGEMETGIKFACDMDNESNEEELLLTAVTNITELLFIIGEDNIGNLLSETDVKLTMPKFTECAVKHREQVEEKMEQEEPAVAESLEFGAKTETTAPPTPSLSFGVRVDAKDEEVVEKEPEAEPVVVVVEKEAVKEEPKVESVSVQKKVKKVPISPIVVSPVVKPVRPVK